MLRKFINMKNYLYQVITLLKYSLIHLLTKIDSIFNLLYIHLQKVIFMLIFTALLDRKKEMSLLTIKDLSHDFRDKI